MVHHGELHTSAGPAGAAACAGVILSLATAHIRGISVLAGASV